MFKFYINTDSRTLSSVEIYADAEKRTRLNSPLDAVERFAHEVRIGFLGAHAPGAADKVTLVVAWDGVTDSVLEAQTSANRFYIEAVGTRVEDAEAAGEPPTWSFDVKLASAALEAAFSSRTRLTLRAAAVVENEAAGTHVEHQFTIAGNASIYAGGISDPSGGIIQYLKVVRISWEDYQALESLESGVHYDVVGAPSEVDEHDKDPAAHPELLRRIAAAKGDLMERLGVAGVMSEGAFLGVDADGMLRVPKASADTLGTSKLSTGTAMGVNDGAIGHDSNGALRVASATAEVKGTVYLPASEASGLGSAAASLELLRTKATASSVACGATDASDNCNQYSFVGPLSALGVTGAAADLNSVTFYRRANNTPNGDTQVYLRLLKKTVGADGNAAWQIASQSVNAVSFSAQPINGGKCGTFYMRRVAGVEPPTCSETVALVMVGAADAEVNTSLQFGCKVAPSATGGVCVSIPIGDAITADKGGLAVVPLVDVTWTPCAPAVGSASYDAPGIVQLSLAATLIDDPLGIGKQADGRIVCDMAQVRAVVNAAVAGVAAALEARVVELETAKADLEARVAALEGA